MLYRIHLDPVSITRDDVLSTLYCRGTYGECIWHIVATLSFLKKVNTGDVSQARWLPPNQAWALGRVTLDKLMWLNAPAPSCVFHGIPSLCHFCLRHVVLWKIHKMQVVLKQCNGLLKRVSSSTQAQCATCLHGNWELNVSLVLFFFQCFTGLFAKDGTLSHWVPSAELAPVMQS